MPTSVSWDSGQGKPKLLDRVRDAIRFKHYSLRTEQAYADWIKRFILFHGKRHPEAMGAEEVRTFLSDLAVNQNVAASTQNQGIKRTLVSLSRSAQTRFALDRQHRAGQTASEGSRRAHA